MAFASSGQSASVQWLKRKSLSVSVSSFLFTTDTVTSLKYGSP